MAEAIEYEQFDSSAQPDGAGDQVADLTRLSAIPMELTVEIGRTQMTVGETLDLHPGSVVELDRLAGEPADLLVNGTPIARGEVVVVGEQFGLRVTEILDRAQELQDAAGTAALVAGPEERLALGESDEASTQPDPALGEEASGAES